MVGFFLVLATVKDQKCLNILVVYLMVLISFIAFEGILQYKTGFALGGIEPIMESHVTADGALDKVARIRWYGVFNDPNDLGLLFIFAIPFLIEMARQRMFLVPLVSLPLVFTSLYFTNSRGSMLAALASIAAYFIILYRNLKGAVIAVGLAALLFLFGPSRMADISAQEESAHGRIEAWYQGYQMFKSNPIFGVGMGRYTEFHDLTAHNSFVLVMAETGVVGLFFFTGLIYYPLNALWDSVFKDNSERFTRSDLGTISAVYASLLGMLVAIFFISRAYVLLPFLLIALAASVGDIFKLPQSLRGEPSRPYPRHFSNVLKLTLLQVVGINIIVKVCL
jgi:hypothetical protein